MRNRTHYARSDTPLAFLVFCFSHFWVCCFESTPTGVTSYKLDESIRLISFHHHHHNHLHRFRALRTHPLPFCRPRFRYPIVWWTMSGTRPALMIAGKSGRCNDEGWRDTFSYIRYVFNFISHPSHPYHSIATRRKDSIDRPPSPNCWNANMNVVGCDSEGSQVGVSWKSDP